MTQPVFVFVASNWLGQMYVGITRNLPVAMRQLKERSVIPPGMAAGVDKLLLWREFAEATEAQRFESTLHHLSRKTLLELAKNVNPFLIDLSADWYRSVNGSLQERTDASMPLPWAPGGALGDFEQFGRLGSASN